VRLRQFSLNQQLSMKSNHCAYDGRENWMSLREGVQIVDSDFVSYVLVNACHNVAVLKILETLTYIDQLGHSSILCRSRKTGKSAWFNETVDCDSSLVKSGVRYAIPRFYVSLTFMFLRPDHHYGQPSFYKCLYRITSTKLRLVP
jgi:hypothetical protein